MTTEAVRPCENCKVLSEILALRVQEIAMLHKALADAHDSMVKAERILVGVINPRRTS